MTGFQNYSGRVTGRGLDFIEIDSVRYPITTSESISRIVSANPSVGDRVEFNFNTLTKEIIFMKNHDRKPSQTSYPRMNRYVEDPRDPDEVHDMAAVYGHSFEGM